MSFRLPGVEIERCKKCGWRKTKWIAGRGGQFSRCEECGDRFPCAMSCAHEDCAEVRQKLSVGQPISKDVASRFRSSVMAHDDPVPPTVEPDPEPEGDDR